MIEPTQVIEAFKKHTSSLLPIPTSTSVAPIPTVVPNRPHYETVTETGTKTLWVVWVVMLLSTLGFAFLAFRVPVQKRLFHVITSFITLFATISYFAMATGDGNTFAKIVVNDSTKEILYRQVFWARYVDWTLTTPLLLLDLAFLAGLSGANILVAIVADMVMVLLGLFAAFGKTDGQKWGYYAMACAAMLVIFYQLVVPGRESVRAKDGSTAKLFTSIGLFTIVLWTLYPIVWGVGEGAHRMSVDAEIICYAILDILAKPVFGFWLLFAHRSAPAVEGWWSNGLGSEGSVRLDDDGA